MVLLALLATLALAQSYPERVDPYVNDFAQILSSAQASDIRELFQGHNSQKGIEIVLVTLPSLAEYGAEEAPFNGYVGNLFDSWGIGDRERRNGILLLFAEGDREVRIQLGSSYGDEAERQAEQVIDTMLPHFQKGRYPAGLVAGARELVKIGSTTPPALPAPKSYPWDSISNNFNNWLVAYPQIFTAAGLLVALICIILAIRTARRHPDMLWSSYDSSSYYGSSSDSGSSSSRGGGRSSGSGASGSWSSSSSGSSSGGRGASGKW